jgi:hypothetical protein
VNVDDANPAAFYKDDMGGVHLRGIVKATQSICGYDIFRLPVGYGPQRVERFSTLLNTNGGNFDALRDGPDRNNPRRLHQRVELHGHDGPLGSA